jgi:hypothetical protein
MDPTKNRGLTQVLGKDRKFHIHLLHPLWKEIGHVCEYSGYQHCLCVLFMVFRVIC